MKRIPCLFFVLLLAACAPVLAPATTTPTLTPTLTRTSAPAPTSTIPPTISATTTPSLPADLQPEFQAMLENVDWEIRDGHVWVTTADGEQDWFEQTPEKQWQTTDWKMHRDAPINSTGWEPKKNWSYDNDGFALDAFPVFTGEAPFEVQLILNGQEITITVLPAQIRDMLDANIIKDVLIPLVYKDSSGNVLAETDLITGDGMNPFRMTFSEFLAKAQRGLQVEARLGVPRQRGACQGGLVCEFCFDLIKAQNLDLENGKFADGSILPIGDIRDFFKILW